MMMLQVDSSWMRMQTSKAQEEVTYRPCPVCGFRLMEVLPPTRRTYPFSREHCPICGYHRDQHGVKPGRQLSSAAKAAAFKRWMLDHGLDENLLRLHYHISPDAFFVEDTL